jgi:hypothetical protein
MISVIAGGIAAKISHGTRADHARTPYGLLRRPQAEVLLLR